MTWTSKRFINEQAVLRSLSRFTEASATEVHAGMSAGLSYKAVVRILQDLVIGGAVQRLGRTRYAIRRAA